MTPLSVYIVPRRQVEELTSTPPVPQEDLNNYLSVRPDILSDGFCDIFQPNCRSTTHAHAVFSLFNIVDNVESGTVVVFPFWLELFENFGCRQHIATCINWLAATYPNNPVIVQWNSDRDQATVPELQDLRDNIFVLTYNTSRPNPTDILLPFWTIETNQKWDTQADRNLRGGFIGYVGGLKLRQRMLAGFRGQSQWAVVDTENGGRLPEREYIQWMQDWDFALCPRGGGLNSYRLFEALQCGCVPIMFADDVRLPYPDLDWPSLIVHVPEKMAGDFDGINILLGFVKVEQRRERIAAVRERFGLAGVQREIYHRIREYLQ